MTRVLLAGRNGQVGWELERSLAPLGEVVALDRAGMDLADPDSIVKAIRGARPDVIVNAAAYTAVDRAESEPDLAMRINGVAPGIIAGEAARSGALVVHYSTDYVFDGAKAAPYREDDATGPASAYGRTKLAGEEAVRAAGAPHLIFRTSWVYCARGSNFLLTMLRLAGERSELRIVDDQVGAPTWARSIAQLTARALGAGGAGPGPAREKSGVYHLAAAGAVSWFGFAQAIFAQAGARRAEFRTPALTPIPTSQYPLPARRPSNSRLDTSKLAAAFGLTPPGWEVMLGECMKEVRIPSQK
jgi:dTDP-4-dehydrorhamnose reductase